MKTAPAQRRVLLDEPEARRSILEAALLQVSLRHLDERGDVGHVLAGLSQRL